MTASAPTPGLAGVVALSEHREHAQALAQRLGVSLLTSLPSIGLVLVASTDRLELRDAARPATRPIWVDLSSRDIAKRLRAGKRGQLARAIGLARRPGLSVFDATCGLARDSAVLLGLGCTVQACERHPVLQALIEDGFARAGAQLGWRGLVQADAATWLAQQAQAVADVVYLDPMFGGDRSALPKWEMQALHELAGNDEDAGALLDNARQRARPRVVVKRHPRGPSLAPPDLQVLGKRARFDVYLTPA